jgi:hypothetical protein
MSESSETPCPEKPPRSTQFKPGQSGNPLGRPLRIPVKADSDSGRSRTAFR